MLRQLGEVGLRIGRVDRLERLADLPVQLHPARRGQLVVERVPDEHVAEANAAGRSWRVVENTLGHGLVQDVHQLVGAELAELGERLQAELAAP